MDVERRSQPNSLRSPLILGRISSDRQLAERSLLDESRDNYQASGEPQTATACVYRMAKLAVGMSVDGQKIIAGTIESPRHSPRGLDPPPNRAYVWLWVTPANDDVNQGIHPVQSAATSHSCLGEWCNGSTKDSDSFSLGSNPSSPASSSSASRISCRMVLRKATSVRPLIRTSKL